MKKLKKLFYVLLAVFIAAGLTYAQEDSSKMSSAESQVQQGDEKFVELAENLATDLKDRVDLREDQVEQVQNILVEYFSEVEPVSSGIPDSQTEMDNSGSMNVPPDNTGAGMNKPNMGNMGHMEQTGSEAYKTGMVDTSDTNSDYSSDTSESNYGNDTSGVSSNEGTRTEGTGVGETGMGGTGTGTGSYGDRANVVGQPGNISGSSSISTDGNKTSTMDNTDALGDAFEARQKADNKIQQVLDEDQKKDYASEKGEWWSEIQDKFESA